MKKQRFIITIITLLSVLFIITRVATAGESASYLVGWDVMAAGGAVSQSSSYSLNATVGEPIIGLSSGNNYQVKAGYWQDIGAEKIKLVSQFDTNGSYALHRVGNIVYLADDKHGLRIIDVSNPTTPLELGAYDTPGDAWGVDVINNRAYVADGGSLRVIDVSNPSNPIELGAYETPGHVDGVQVVGNLAYLADGKEGFRIVDVSDPSNIVERGAYDTPEYASRLMVVGDIAYIANRSSGLRLMNVSNPNNPTEIGQLDRGEAQDVFVRDNLAYVSDGDYGLRIIDVSTPSNPIEVGSYPTNGRPVGIVVIGNIAYMTDGSEGLKLFDVSNSNAPVEIAAYDTTGFASDVAVMGQVIYVADSDGGLVILQVTNGNNNTPTPTATPDPGEQFDVDSGFRPNPHGYQFSNYGGRSRFEATDLDAAALINLFGADKVCKFGSTANDCVLKAAARKWREGRLLSMRKGHCAGLAMSSQRFFAGYDPVNTFNASSVYQLAFNQSVSNHIAQWFTVQGLAPADGSGRGWLAQYGDKTPNEFLQLIRDHIRNTPKDILYLGIRIERGGHAVNPYAVANKGNGIYWVYVYDNNRPNEERYVIFDTNENTWRYAFGANPAQIAGAWEGNAQTKTQRLRPATALNHNRWHCYFCSVNGQRNGRQFVDTIEFQLTGEGTMLIVDQQGRSIGWDSQKGMAVNEISGSIVNQVDTGLGFDTSPIYQLPQPTSEAPYTVYVSGDSLTETAETNLMMVGHGFAAGLALIELDDDETLQLTMSPNGQQIAFNANATGRFGPDIFFALDPDEDGDSYIFEMAGFDLESSKTVTTTLDMTSGMLYFGDDDGAADSYELAVTRIKADGTEAQYFNDAVNLDGADQAVMNFGQWDGSGGMTFTIGGQEVVLANQPQTASNKTYLPIVIK